MINVMVEIAAATDENLINFPLGSEVSRAHAGREVGPLPAELG